jgi:hypothetical protein
MKKPTKIIGMNIDNFRSLVNNKEEIILRPARLIPFYKPGDEMSLTSIFLAGLRLIKEFRELVFKSINVSKSGNILVFTEVEFLLFDNKRIDGLLLVVRGKKILEAVILEMKNKNNPIDEVQISSYVEIAKAYGVSKIVTVSNQFVSQPTQSPISLRLPKSVEMYHLSWSYILTIAHILLFKNDNNIADEDQVEIMKEIVKYFENEKSGVIGFTQMRAGWTELIQKMNTGALIKLDDDCLSDTITGWLEEERDMALILSRELGLLVESVKTKFKNDLVKRIEYEKRELIKTKSIQSILRVNGAVSDIEVSPNFERRNIRMGVNLLAPQDKGIRGQISWLKNQINRLEKKNFEGFNSIKDEIIIEINLKFSNTPILVGIDELDDIYFSYKDKQVKNFNVLQIKYLGKKIEGRKVIIDIIEGMLLNYYEVIIQHLKKWQKPAPKIVKNNNIEEIEQIPVTDIK